MDSDYDAHSIYIPSSVESFKQSLQGRISKLTLSEARKQLQICCILNPECMQDQVYLSKLSSFLQKKIDVLEEVQAVEKAIKRSQRRLSILKGNIRIIQTDEEAKKILSHRSSATNFTECTQELDYLLNIINDEREYIVNDSSQDGGRMSSLLTESQIDEVDNQMSSLMSLDIDSPGKGKTNRQFKNSFLKEKMFINLLGLFDKEVKGN